MNTDRHLNEEAEFATNGTDFTDDDGGNGVDLRSHLPWRTAVSGSNSPVYRGGNSAFTAINRRKPRYTELTGIEKFGSAFAEAMADKVRNSECRNPFGMAENVSSLAEMKWNEGKDDEEK